MANLVINIVHNSASGRPSIRIPRCFPHSPDNVCPSFPPLISPAFLGWSLREVSIFPSRPPWNRQALLPSLLSSRAKFAALSCPAAPDSRLKLVSQERCRLAALMCHKPRRALLGTGHVLVYLDPSPCLPSDPFPLTTGCRVSLCRIHSNRGSTDLAAMFRCLDRGNLFRSVKRRDAPISRSPLQSKTTCHDLSPYYSTPVLPFLARIADHGH